MIVKHSAKKDDVNLNYCQQECKSQVFCTSSSSSSMESLFCCIIFLVVAIGSIFMDASMNHDLKQVQTFSTSYEISYNRSQEINETVQIFQEKATNFSTTSHQFHKKTANVVQQAINEANIAAYSAVAEEQNLAMAQYEDKEYHTHLAKASKDLESSKHYFQYATVFEQKKSDKIQQEEEQEQEEEEQQEQQQHEGYFCHQYTFARRICHVLGSAANIGKAPQQSQQQQQQQVQFYDMLRNKSLTKANYEQAQAEQQNKSAMKAHELEIVYLKLAERYDHLRRDYKALAVQHLQDAKNDSTLEKYYKEQADLYKERASLEEQTLSQVVAEMNTEKNNRNLWASYVPTHAFYASLCALLAMTLYCFFITPSRRSDNMSADDNDTSCIQHVTNNNVFQEHHMQQNEKLPHTLQQSIITYTVCHGFILLLVLGFMKDHLEHIYDYRLCDAGEIVLLTAMIACAIETMFFSVWSFLHNTSLFHNNNDNNSNIHSDTVDWSNIMQQAMALSCVFTIQVFILICTYTTQTLILLVLFGHSAYFLMMIQWLNQWSYYLLGLLAVFRLVYACWFPLQQLLQSHHHHHNSSSSNIEVGTLRDMTLLIPINDNHTVSTGYSSITASENNNNNNRDEIFAFDPLMPFINHTVLFLNSISTGMRTDDSHSSILPWNRQHSVDINNKELQHSNMEQQDLGVNNNDHKNENEFTWLQAELYFLYVCFQCLVLSCVIAVYLNALPHTNSYILQVSCWCYVVVILVFQLYHTAMKKQGVKLFFFLALLNYMVFMFQLNRNNNT